MYDTCKGVRGKGLVITKVYESRRWFDERDDGMNLASMS